MPVLSTPTLLPFVHTSTQPILWISSNSQLAQILRNRIHEPLLVLTWLASSTFCREGLTEFQVSTTCTTSVCPILLHPSTSAANCKEGRTGISHVYCASWEPEDKYMTSQCNRKKKKRKWDQPLERFKLQTPGFQGQCFVYQD